MNYDTLDSLRQQADVAEARRLLRNIAGVLTDAQIRELAYLLSNRSSSQIASAILAVAPAERERAATVVQSALGDQDLSSPAGIALLISGLPTIMNGDGSFRKEEVDAFINSFGLGKVVEMRAKEVAAKALAHDPSVFQMISGPFLELLGDLVAEQGPQMIRSALRGSNGAGSSGSGQ